LQAAGDVLNDVLNAVAPLEEPSAADIFNDFLDAVAPIDENLANKKPTKANLKALYHPQKKAAESKLGKVIFVLILVCCNPKYFLYTILLLTAVYMVCYCILLLLYCIFLWVFLILNCTQTVCFRSKWIRENVLAQY
jgi:hypothetical protein